MIDLERVLGWMLGLVIYAMVLLGWWLWSRWYNRRATWCDGCKTFSIGFCRCKG